MSWLTFAAICACFSDSRLSPAPLCSFLEPSERSLPEYSLGSEKVPDLLFLPLLEGEVEVGLDENPGLWGQIEQMDLTALFVDENVYTSTLF